MIGRETRERILQVCKVHGSDSDINIAAFHLLCNQLIEQALEALVAAYQGKDKTNQVTEAITALRTALEQPQPVQVSPLDFTHAVLGKEDAIGRPIFWAEWPNREKA